MCDVCENGVVGRFEGETIFCNFCPEGLGKTLNRLDAKLGSYANRLRNLDTLDALNRLDQEGRAWRAEIQEDHDRVSAYYKQVEHQFVHLANPMLARMEVTAV